MAVQGIQDLFLHELSDIYDGEQRIAKILPQLANEVPNDQVKSAFQEHERETRQQIQNLEQCFQILGAKPKQVTCAAIQGLKQEHDSFTRENPGHDILTMFNLGAASKTEHYEIASYQGLVEKANMMGQQECARLLQENLRQEEEMARRVQQIGRQLGQQMIQQKMGPEARM